MPSENQQDRVLDMARRVPLFSKIFRRLNPRQQEIISFLRHTPSFSNLSGSEFIDLLYLLHERVFVPGEVIFNEGEPGLGLYVVFKGEVDIRTSTKNGKDILARLGACEIFGEVSFLDGGSRSATAIAAMKTELLGFYRTELFDLLDRKPALASKILFALGHLMSIRVRAMLQQIQT